MEFGELPVTSREEADLLAADRLLPYALGLREKIERTIQLTWKPGQTISLVLEGNETAVAEEIVAKYNEAGWNATYTPSEYKSSLGRRTDPKITLR